MDIDAVGVKPQTTAGDDATDLNPDASTSAEATRKRKAPLAHAKDEFAALLEPFYFG